MAKLTLDDLSSLTNETTAVASINANSALIETALENTLSRDGTSPNSMSAQLDMNSNKIINLATPTAGTDAANKTYVDSVVTSGVTGAAGADGADGSSPDIFVQNTAPATTGLAGSLWIDADSVSLDLYRLTGGAWVDTGADLKGSSTATGDVTATDGSGSSSTFGTDNRIIRSDGTGRNVSASAATLADTAAGGAALSGISTITAANNGDDIILYQTTDTSVGAKFKIVQDTTVPRGFKVYVDVDGGGYHASPSISFQEGISLITTLNLTNALAVDYGGTGATTVAGACSALGLGTEDTPNFTAIELGNGSTDCTLARGGVGRMTVEGSNVIMASDAATTSAAGIAALATAAEVVTGSNSTKAVTPSAINGAQIFGNIPQVSKSVNYTLVLTDQGKHILHPSTDGNSRTFTIPTNANVAFPIGTTVSFINSTANVVSIVGDVGVTLNLSSAGTTGTRSLSRYGIATAIKVENDVWYIGGTGLT